MTIATQDRQILYVQPDGKFTPIEPVSLDKHGSDDVTDNTVPTQSVLFGRDPFGRPSTKVVFDQAPGGLVNVTINYDKQNSIDFFETAVIERRIFNLLNFLIPAGRIDNYANWLLNGRLDVLLNCRVATPVTGAGPAKDYAGAVVANSVQLNAEKHLILLPPTLVAQTTSETEDINRIAGLTDLDPNEDIPGYPGHDKVLFAACDAGSGVTANILYSINGGGTWAALGADPFGADEHINGLAVMFMTPTQYRVIALRQTTDGSNPAEIAYTDITLGNESATPTWTNVNLTGSANGDVGESLFWPTQLFGRQYVGASGDIYVSTNQGESLAAVYTGSNAINAFAIDKDKNVWAVGASNLILKESAENRGTFDTKVGPSGGGAMSAIAVADDDTIFVGNGTSLYRSNNGAASTGGWTAVKDFGSNHSVKKIQVIAGNSQFVRVVVSDSSGTDGDVWYSFDGGNSFKEVADLSNSGYNDAYFSEVDPNFAIIVGEDDGSTGVIHKLTS